MTDRNFQAFPVLATDRLTMRQLVDNDDYEIFYLRSNEQVNKYLGRKLSLSIDEAKVFIQTVNENIEAKNSIYWAITLNGSDKLIGTICLFDISTDNCTAEIGYELMPQFQRNGFMKEAMSKVIDYGFREIGLDLISACSHVENRNSLNLLQKFEFEKQGSGKEDLILFTLRSRPLKGNNDQ